jgi:hypothetical protein
VSRLTAASDMDYDVETGNETPDPRLAEEEYRERRLAELIECLRAELAESGCDAFVLVDDLGLAMEGEHVGNGPRAELREYGLEFGWPSTLRALASALEPPQ